jgi:phage shock protein C
MSAMKKRLTKCAKEDSRVEGVCGGIANHFQLDPTYVRVAFALFALAGGPGIILYLILMLSMEEAPDEEPHNY